MATETKPEQVPVTYIKCMCGNNAFIPARILAPGEKHPSTLSKVWVCAGCGMHFTDEDFPKKGEEETRKENKSKLILPDSPGKLKLVN